MTVEDTTSDVIKRWQSSIVLIFLALIVYLPMAYIQSYILTRAMADFPAHIAWAEQIKKSMNVPFYVILKQAGDAHAGWQVLLLLFNALFGLPFQTANLAAVVLCEVVTALLLWQWFWPLLRAKYPAIWKQAVIILGIGMATPISALWFVDHKFYLGYIGITSYHSPTIILLRPLALLQFLYALRCFEPRRTSKIELLGMAMISMLAAFAKPNFAIDLLPAMTILGLQRMLQRRNVDLAAFLAGFALPTLFVLTGQFLITYQRESGIIFAPFTVMSHYSGFLLPKLLLSILFPLLVTIIYRRRVWHDAHMRLAWLIFVFGGFYTYFLAEGGPRLYDGNFGWSGEIGLFVLFAAASWFFLSLPESSGKSKWLLRFVWLGHVAVGVMYYAYFLATHVYV